MNVFGIGLPEMVVIAAIGLLVFGPKRLPELGKTLGRTLKGFQSASQEFEQELRAAVAAPTPVQASGQKTATESSAAESTAAELSGAIAAPAEFTAGHPVEPPANAVPEGAEVPAVPAAAETPGG